MARNRIFMQGSFFDTYMAKLDELGGTDAMKKGVNLALAKSKAYVNPEIKKAMEHLPAGGKYSTGRTLRSLDERMDVEWKNMIAEMKVGFDMNKSGITSIMLIHGTPRMKPVAGLKTAIYGSKTKKKIAEIQQEQLMKVIKEIMEG